MRDEILLKIVRRAMDGDLEAFRELCERKGRDILYMAMHLMGNRQDGEDATQEIIIYMHEHMKELKNPEAFHIWLYRIINGTCANMRRKNKNTIVGYEQAEHISEERRIDFLPQEFVEDESKRELLLTVINELKPKQKACILLFYYEGMSYLEIAEALEMNKKEVDNTLMRGRQNIRKRLDKHSKTKDYLKKSYGVVVVPVLTQVLKADIEAKVGAGAVHKVIDRSMEKIIKSLGTGALKEIKPKQSPSAGTGLKIFAIATVAAGAIAAAAYVNKQPEKEAEIYTETVQSEEQQPTEIKMEQQETGQTIDTLEDMIGEGEAEMLRKYANSKSVSKSNIESFLEQIGAELEEGIQKVNSPETYGLYIRQRETKLLMVILRMDQETGECEVCFRFTESTETMPKDIELAYSFLDW